MSDYMGHSQGGGYAASSSSGTSSGGAGMIGGIIGGVNGVVSNIVSRNDQVGANRENRKQFWYSKMYDNWYNSPSEVVKRLKSAGINPAVAFGGINNTASAGSPPEAKVQPMDGNVVNEGIRTGVQTAVSLEQLANMKAQRGLLEAQTRNSDADTLNKAESSGLATATKANMWTRLFSDMLTADVGRENTRASTANLKQQTLRSSSLLAPDIEAVNLGNRNKIAEHAILVQQRKNLVRQYYKTADERKQMWFDTQLKRIQVEYYEENGHFPSDSYMEGLMKYYSGRNLKNR